MQHLTSYLTTIALLIQLSLIQAQTTYTSVTDGNWYTSETWSPAGTPNLGGGDQVFIEHDIVKPGNHSLYSSSTLTIRNGGSYTITGSFTTGNWGSPILTIEAGGELNLGEDLISTGADQMILNGTVNARNFYNSGAGSGTMSIGGVLNLTGYFSHNVARTMTINNGKITTGGDFVVGSSSAILNTTGTTINVGADLLVQGSAQFNHASDTLLVAGDFVNTGSVGVDFYGWVDIDGGAYNIGSSRMTFNGPTTIGSLTGTGATVIEVNSELLVEGNINISGSADIQGSAGGILGWNGTFTTDNSGSRIGCGNGTEYDTDGSSAEPEPPFNPIDLADCGEGEFIALPIELASFTAELNGGHTNINWTTLLEENNDYFTLLRSEDGVNFYAIAIIDGAGSSSVPLQYNHRDYDINPGANGYYYQLMQTDYDGSNTKSEIIYIPIDNGNKSLAWVKNPATNNEFIITLNTPNELPITFTVYNALGTHIEIGNIVSVGQHQYILSFSSKLNSGLYILTINNSLQEDYHKIIVE